MPPAIASDGDAMSAQLASDEEVKIKAKLVGIDRWGWNIFELEEVCKPHVISISKFRLTFSRLKLMLSLCSSSQTCRQILM